MEKPFQLFDICIVCALPEEARAFLEVVQQQCEDTLEERISPRYQYSYRFATLKNDKDEPLNLHISWLPRYGPQEMTLHLSRVLEECQPRIAIMTGICAGDAQQAQLGDLVVAERTFTYDNGKFTSDEHGRTVHLHDTMTYQLDANILQFLGLFDDWKALIAKLESPPSSLDPHNITCHIKAMASGSAVRADHPFEDIRAPVRGTVAIDMEGAAFGLVMSRHPLIRWLVVKGVCDYADRAKNDAYHDYTARASALYALSFIRAYITHERLPRSEGLPADRAGPTKVWNVPYRRNPHFTGRDALLNRLEQQLSSEAQEPLRPPSRAALTQPKAIKGLGGIGKTQIAVEYAYRSRDFDRYTHTFWINAASEEALITSFAALAELLPAFPEKGETDQQKLVIAIRHWLEECQQGWLLIFDNADDVALVSDYLPQRGNGSILLTTRANAVGALATSIEVETMGFIEGTHLLLRRAQRFEQASDEEVNQAGNIVIALDHFPLALDQAGAYIEETQCSFADYLDIYQNHRQALLAQRGTLATAYPNSVATTWSLSFQKVQQANPATAELLQLCAFLAPDKIPEELIRDGAVHWSPLLQGAAVDLYAFNQMIEELLKFSLVKRLTDDRMLSIHRLVQAVQRDTMGLEMQRRWAERVVYAMNEVFPHNPQDTTNWPQCLRYLEQAQACDTLIQHYMLLFSEAAYLLRRTGTYLVKNAFYTIAEPLYQRALRIQEQQVGPEHPEVASLLNSLASLYHKQGKYAEIEPIYQRALRIWEQQPGPEQPGMASLLSNLASLYREQGKYAEAEPLYQRALHIREQQLEPEHPDVASLLNKLASLYTKQGKYVEAEPLYQRILRIWEQQSGPENLDMAYPLNGLAELYREQGKYEEAEPLYQRILRIWEQQPWPEHPDMVYPLQELAGLYREQGKYGEAEPLYQRALRIWEQQPGPEQPEVAVLLAALASLYDTLGRYTEAEPLYQRALRIREQQPGPEQPDMIYPLNRLANLYSKQERYTEAEPLYQHTLRIWEQQPGPEQPGMANPLNGLAELYREQGKYEEAEPLYQRALVICESILGRGHPNTQTIRENYASLLQITGRDAEAKQLDEGS